MGSRIGDPRLVNFCFLARPPVGTPFPAPPLFLHERWATPGQMSIDTVYIHVRTMGVYLCIYIYISICMHLCIVHLGNPQSTPSPTQPQVRRRSDSPSTLCQIPQKLPGEIPQKGAKKPSESRLQDLKPSRKYKPRGSSLTRLQTVETWRLVVLGWRMVMFQFSGSYHVVSLWSSGSQAMSGRVSGT